MSKGWSTGRPRTAFTPGDWPVCKKDPPSNAWRVSYGEDLAEALCLLGRHRFLVALQSPLVLQQWIEFDGIRPLIARDADGNQVVIVVRSVWDEVAGIFRHEGWEVSMSRHLTA